MNNNVMTQLYSLFIFIISGIIIGIFFDIFRILRRSFKTPDFITYIEDIIFWILTGVFFLFILFTFQNGQIRSYNIVGLIIGITAYLLTISKYFIKLNVILVKFFKNIIIYPLKLFFKPISFVVINIRKNITKFDKKIKESPKKLKQNEKKSKKYLRKEGF